MSSLIKIPLKQIKSTAKEHLAKNKIKIIQKASSYIIEKAISGPYTDIVVGAAKSVKKKYLPRFGSYAFKKFIRSKYAIEKINTIPLSIFSIIMRTIVGILLVNNFKTGDRYTDFSISVSVTAFITIISPFFYTVAESQSDKIINYTYGLVDTMSRSKEYSYHIEQRFLYKSVVMVIMILMLNFYEITSRGIQEMIFHSLVSSLIVEFIDVIWRWKYKMTQLHYGMTCYYTTIWHLTSKNYEEIPLRQVKFCDTNDMPRMIENYIRPSRAQIIRIEDDISKLIDNTPIVIFE